MSDTLHPELLRWTSRGGIACRHGRTVVLTEAPNLGRGPVHELWFDPAMQSHAYAKGLDGEHLLDDQERAAAMLALRDAVPTVPGAL